MMNRREVIKAAGIIIAGLGVPNLLPANTIELNFDKNYFDISAKEDCDTKNSKVWHSADMSTWKFVEDLGFDDDECGWVPIRPKTLPKNESYRYIRSGIAEVREDAFIWVAKDNTHENYYHVYGKIKMNQSKLVIQRDRVVEIRYINWVKELTSETKFGKKLCANASDKIWFEDGKISVLSKQIIKFFCIYS